MNDAQVMVGWFVTYKGVPQNGMWAHDQEALQDLIDDYFEEVKKCLEHSPEDWSIEECTIIYGVESD